MIDQDGGTIMAQAVGRTTVIIKEEGTDKIAVIPLVITENSNIEPMVETNGSHTVMLKVDGTVWTYGIGANGELGNDTQDTVDEPVQAIFPSGTKIVQVSAGENHCLALDENGNVWAWGRNNYYQLGNTNENSISTPTKVTGLSGIRKITCGANTSYAIGNTGEVYSFGLNANGEGGVGTYTNKIPVTRAKNITDIVDIRAGKNHAIILKSTGEVYVTGSNLYGELGQNDVSIRKTKEFTKVPNLRDIVKVGAGDSQNLALKIDGTVMTWGANIYKQLGTGITETSSGIPTKVEGLSNIRYIDGGKGTNTAIDKDGNVYVCGLNTNGELGNGTKSNVSTYEKLETINNVLQMSIGNTYTNYLKYDGTVWGVGDYSHGDEEVRSKTKGTIPVQVGNDETGLTDTEIILKVGETKDLTLNSAYAFNLIYLNENFKDELTYNSLKEEIATISEKGIVQGARIGTTRVNAVSKKTGKTYSVLVKVIPISRDIVTAPKIGAGENFAVVLKGDGSIWTFGYNGDGRLGTGDYKTRDIPTKTNILATYQDLKVGQDFVLALRQDGTVWGAGSNKKGQLGSTTDTTRNKLHQIVDLSKITKIAAGDNFGIALDSYGIVYEWGNDNAKVREVQKIGQRIIDISAGKNQSVYVTAKGTVIGKGSILEGEIPNLSNAIRVEVTENSIIILCSDGKVHEYKAGVLTQIPINEHVIEISASKVAVMYQTVSEKTYVSGQNINGELGTGNKDSIVAPVLVQANGENTYGIGAGYNNTYIIENTGNVYASGANQYGSIGNGRRQEELTHTLVGDRKFGIEPESKTMREGDSERIEIIGTPFNVFNYEEISANEYTWESKNKPEDIVGNVVDIEINESKATLIAKQEGTAIITVTDKVTGEKIELTRIVLPQDKDRISKISVNDINVELSEESTEDNLIYKVKVVTNENTGVLRIETNNKTDAISIDAGATWSYNGDFNKTVDLPNKITEFEILVGIRNNEGEYPEDTRQVYKLIVEKISDDVTLKTLTATTKDETGNETEIVAKPVSLTKYEAVISENTDISKIFGETTSEYSSISIDGGEYKLHSENALVTIGGELTKEIRITVKSEAGRETEYTLVLFEQNAALELISLTVDGEEATKISEGAYAKKVGKDTEKVQVQGIVNSDLAYVSINGNEYAIKTNSSEIELTGEETEVIVRTKLDEGKYKEYVLTIQKEKPVDPDDPDNPDNPEVPKIDLIIVNGKLITPEKDGKTYIAYLPSITTDAEIRAIAKETTTSVKINEEEAELGDTRITVAIQEAEENNTHKVHLTGQNGLENEYTVIIRKAGTDTSLSELYAKNGDTRYNTIKQDQENYTLKVPGNIETLDITAITGYANSKVQVLDTGVYKTHQDTQRVTLTEEETKVKIKVQSEDGTVEKEYYLTITKMSNNTELLKVQVDGEDASLGEDGIYRYSLKKATDKVTVFAETKTKAPKQTWVNIENSTYALYETEKEIDITAHETTVKIRVKAEDGTIKDYLLIIEGLPDDVNIKEVTVNTNKAEYNYNTGRYEVKCKEDTYDVEVILNDSLATLKLGTNAEKQGQDTITIAKDIANDETLLTVEVTSQSGLVTETYTIAILEQSKNNNLDTITVNGQNVTQNEEGIYYIGLPNATQALDITATAEDTSAITKIADNANTSHIATLKESTIDGQAIYEYIIKVTAENGEEAEYKLKVELLEANYNILEVRAGQTAEILNKAILKEDGTYYYKIKRADEGFVEVDLESTKSKVSINGEETQPARVSLPNEITEIPIVVTGEDGSQKEYKLIIEKESNDTRIKEITGEGIIRKEINESTATLYVDEDITDIDLNIILNNKYGFIKVDGEEAFEQGSIIRNISFTDTSYIMNLQIRAEDGTEMPYTVNIYKEANLNLLSVVVNSEEIGYNEESGMYEALVPNGTKPNVVITPENILHKVMLVNSAGTTVGEKNGVLTVTPTLSTTSLEDDFIIKVISHNGENAGLQEYKLKIRQKSKDTEILYIKVDGLGTLVNGTTYTSTVSGKEEYPVEIKLNDEKASAKVLDTSGTTLIDNQIGTITGNLAVSSGTSKSFKVVVTAENGNQKEYTLTITRITSQTEIGQITVTDYNASNQTITKEVTEYNEETKTYRVQLSNKITTTEISVTAVSAEATIELNGMSAKKTVKANQNLPGLGITTVTVNVTAADGTKETRYLEIVQYPSETGIEYVGLDGIELTQKTSEPNYSTSVFGKDKYPVEVRLTDEKAKVRIEDKAGNIVLADSIGTLTGDLSIPDGATKEFVIVVTAQDGTVKKYSMNIERISSNIDIEKITVTDQTSGGEDVTKEVTAYDTSTKTYKITINKDLGQTKITIKAKTQNAEIAVDSTKTGKGTVEYDKTLDGSIGTTRTTTVAFEVTAADGVTKETKYIQIIQLNNNIGLKEVYVDEILILPNGAGEYECTLTDAVNLAKVKAVAEDETSKVAINGEGERLAETEVNVSKANARKLEVPIKVTAADGSEYIHMLRINIISTNANVQEVVVDGEKTALVEDVYTAYIDKYETKAKVEIKSAEEHAEISYTMPDGAVLFNTGRLPFDLDTSDLDQEEFEITFKIIAEDGVTEKEYKLKCIRKSDDYSIKEVYVDDIQLEENSMHPEYPDGSYSTQTIANSAKVKVIANSEIAKVEFAGSSGQGMLEKYVELDLSNKITEIPVKITSQQGNTYETIIYIKRVSNNCNLKSVKVDTKLAHISEEEANTYYAYVYDTANKARIQIEAENENATVIRTDEIGNTWLDENGVSSKGTPELDTRVNIADEEKTTIYFKIVAENGQESPVYKLNLEDMSVDTSLESVYVNGILVEQDETGKYVTTVYDTSPTVDVKAVTNNENAYVRISLGREYLHIAEGKVTLSAEKQTQVPIIVRSQSGITKTTTLYINVISTNAEINVTLDGKDSDYYKADTKTYTFIVDDTKEDYELQVIAESDRTVLEFEGAEHEGSFAEIVHVYFSEEGKTYYVQAKTEAGGITTYRVDIVRSSDNVNLEFLKVDGVEIFPDGETGKDRYNYTVTIPKETTGVLIEAQTEHKYANLQIGDNAFEMHYEKGTLDCPDLTQIQIVVPINVIAADGKTRITYNLTLVRDTSAYITGKILTENVNGEHVSKVTLYKEVEEIYTDDEGNEQTRIVLEEHKSVETNTDGTFKLAIYDPSKESPELLEAKYTLVVTKPGYLSYTIEHIEPKAESTITIGEYNLIAGDIVEDGEITIADLVAVNDYYGSIGVEGYDLNEDGKVDMLDRTLLKKNYAKKAEITNWTQIVK